MQVEEDVEMYFIMSSVGRLERWEVGVILMAVDGSWICWVTGVVVGWL